MTVTGPYEYNVKYIGLSTDTKPTSNDIRIGTEFFESDTGSTYIYTGDAWAEEL